MSASPLSRRSWPAATALATVLSVGVLTGCSGGTDATADSGTTASSSSESAPAPSSPAAPSSSAGGAETTAPTEAPVGTLSASLVDFAVELPATELEAGTYTIDVSNDGDASHDLVVADAEGNDVAASEILSPGASGTVEVTLEPGEYAFYCSVGNHRVMGMELIVTVV